MIKARVDVYSHHVAVTKLTPRGKEAMLAYCRTLGLTGRVKDGIRWVWKIVSVFVGVQANREMFRFNVSQLDQVLSYLMNYGIPKSEMEIVTHDAPKPAQCKIKMLPKWSTREDQWEYVNYVVSEGYIKTVNLQTGTGKALCLHSKIKIPGGWTTNGALKIGDMVTVPDGSSAKVIGIYPQGIRKVFKIKLVDGRSAEADESHLWKVYHKDRGWFVTTTQSLIILIAARQQLFVPIHTPEVLATADIATLQIDTIIYSGMEETQCILIDHPDHLYVTDDFIVTHNTHIAMRSAELIGERVLLTMKGGYTKKWREDLKDGYGYGPKEIVIPGSTKDLRVLIALGKQGLITQKFIMISNKLLYGFLKHYESSNGDTSFYGCAPHELCEVLGVGFVIRDEVHQEFHFNFRLDLYTHVKKTLNLSATLISDNPIINTMYKWMMPMLTRFGNGTYNKYIDVIAIQYHMLNERVVRCQNLAFKSYSHVLFEQSIMKNSSLTKQYFDFIYDIYAEYYLKERQPGMKSLVFFATVDMCTCFTDYMLRRTDGLVVKRYTQEDDYSNILTAELVVTTLKSAGTAVDIPGLYVAIMTDSINSRQQNEQAVGRLRVMRGPLAHLNPKFIYLYCRTIPKQLEYHLNKREVLRDKVKSIIEINWNFVLGYFR